MTKEEKSVYTLKDKLRAWGILLLGVSLQSITVFTPLNVVYEQMGFNLIPVVAALMIILGTATLGFVYRKD